MQMREVDVELFATGRRSDVAVVDVRSAEEFAAGHVPGAVNVPLERVITDPGRYAGQELYVICQSGGRSAKAAEALTAAGARPVSVGGGTAGWISSGRPVDTGAR
ncbi:rhodanese-like domain-containing protein [Pseudonocardia sp. KRD-169]|uniref:Rhodanese-like domain-containing protein n=2 Tax=Pseudonocardia abyssalis TaxID=2792008 RepID=A0ABS6ULN8_9PSEU|nr:rhodanese-like domain-containing protein [Pseudonocardia abyssalis]MBW0133141.1 rhodanese-like domain-containing protein [Pseudonocardia abyssalis]